MSITTEINFKKEDLLLDLIRDDIDLSDDIIKEAKEGQERALYLIGLEYYYKQKYEKAIAWCHLSASKGDPLASSLMGIMHQKGQGTPVNYSVALKYHLESVQHGVKGSFCNIGEMFEHGLGVPINKQKALEWYSKDESFGTTRVKRLQRQGYHVTDSIRAKPLYDLITETTKILELNEKQELQNKTERLGEENKSLENQACCITLSIQDGQKSFILERVSNQNLSRMVGKNRQIMQEKFKTMKERDNKKVAVLEKENEELKQKIARLEKLLKQSEIAKQN